MAKCEVCSKEFKRAANFINKKKYCSDKCRTIAWALREANKVMKGNKNGKH